jgi:hypothetical protein
MKKVLIVGLNLEGKTVISRLIENSDKEVLLVNNIEAKNIVNSAFENEPIPILNYHKEYFEPKIKDFPRNKYFDKPKNNFKK